MADSPSHAPASSPLRVAAGFAVVLAFVALAVASPVAAGTIKGVVRGSSGDGLETITIAAYDEGGASVAAAVTDDRGRFEIDASCTCGVVAWDPAEKWALGYGNNAPTFESSIVSVPTAGTVDVNFDLVPGAVARGRVIEANGFAPDAATVDFYDAATATRLVSTKTGAGGYFSVAIKPGSYKVVAYRSGAAPGFPVFYSAASDFSSATTLQLAAGSPHGGIDFVLPAGGVVSGAVRGENDEAIADAVVRAYDRFGQNVGEARTNALGVYSLTVRNGTYKLVAWDPALGYATGFPGGAPSFESSPQIAVEDLPAVVDFRLAAAGIVGGIVTDSGTGAGLSGIQVAAYGADGARRGEALTDATGRYQLALPAGRMKIGAADFTLTYAGGFYSRAKHFHAAAFIDVVPGSNRSGIDFALAHGAYVTGSVAASSGAAEGVVIAAYDDDGFRITSDVVDATGRYALSLPPGAYKLVAYDPELRFVNVYSGGTPTFEAAERTTYVGDHAYTADFALTPGVMIAGRVSDVAGVALTGLEVAAMNAAGERFATAGVPDGTFHMVLRPGVYRFVAYDLAGRYLTSWYSGAPSLASAIPVTVSNAGAPEIRFTLQRSGRRRAVAR